MRAVNSPGLHHPYKLFNNFFDPSPYGISYDKSDQVKIESPVCNAISFLVSSSDTITVPTLSVRCLSRSFVLLVSCTTALPRLVFLNCIVAAPEAPKFMTSDPRAPRTMYAIVKMNMKPKLRQIWPRENPNDSEM